MSLADNKKGVLTSISSLTSLSEQQDFKSNNNENESVNNDNDATSFMIEILKVTVGVTALKQLTGQLLTNFINDAEPKLKDSLKKQFKQPNSDKQLPSQFNDGIEIPAKDIDLRGKLKTDPSSNTGSLLYDNSKPTFDNTAYNAIVNDGTQTTFNNLNVEFNAGTENFKFKPTDSNLTVNEWFDEYIDNTEIINKKEFVSKTLDRMYGSISSNGDKNINELLDELKIDEIIKQLINGNDSFKINQDRLNEIFENAKNLKNGVLPYDIGCGVFDMSLSLSDMNALVAQISGSTNPDQIGNLIENSIFNNASGDNDVLNNNSESVKDTFFKKLIKSINFMLVDSLVLTPQVRVLQGIHSALTNNGDTNLGSSSESLDNQKTLIKCLTNEANSMLNEFIFNMVKAALIALITPILSKILKEKINQFLRLIKSLIT